MLDVDRRINIDASGQQLLDIEITLWMPAAGRVGMGEFVDQRDLRMTRDQCVQIHLLNDLILVLNPLAREHLKPLQQCFGLRPPMSFDCANHDIRAGLQLGMGALQHLIGLADTRCGANKDLQPAGACVLPPRGFQQRIRRGSLVRIAALICHAAI